MQFLKTIAAHVLVPRSFVDKQITDCQNVGIQIVGVEMKILFINLS
jgi:hypothetical protein